MDNRRGTHLITLMVNVHDATRFEAAEIQSNLEESIGHMDGAFGDVGIELNSCEVETIEEES